MRAVSGRSPQVTLVFILLATAGAGIALGVFGFAANKATGIAGIASVLVAAFGIVASPWLALHSRGGAITCATLAVAGEVAAASLLLTSPPSNSDLWVPINIGRFGGVLVGEMGLALSVHAAGYGRLGWGRAVVISLANLVAVGLGVAIADWETRA